MSKLTQIVLLTALAAGLYCTGLQRWPAYLHHDEARFAIQARAVAESGQDINGRRLPVYFAEPGFTIGRDPLHVYLTAIVLQMLPFDEFSARLPAASAGVAAVVLMWVLARQLFVPWLAWVAAALLLLTPVHFIHSRLGLSVIYPIPFVLLWLLGVTRFLATGDRRWILGAAAALGAGVYSYIAAAIMMPLYLAATVVLLLWQRRRDVAVAAAGVFAVTLLPLGWWHLNHPDRYSDLAQVYAVYDASRLSPLQGLRDLTSYFSLGERVAIYWQAFNPGRWFFTGDASLLKSTRLVGLFLMPVAVFLVFGVRAALTVRRGPVAALLLLGLATAPLPVVLIAQDDIGRWLVVVPFVCLLATLGVEHLWRLGARWAVLMLLVALPLQFLAFHQDYRGDYQRRAGVWFGGNTRDAVAAAAGSPADVVFLSESIAHVDAYWDFYAGPVSGQARERQRVAFVPALERPELLTEESAVFLTPALDAEAGLALIGEGWTEGQRINNLDGEAAFILWQRVRPAGRRPGGS